MRGKWRGAGRDIHVDITGVQAGSNREFDRAAADGTIVLDKDGDPRTIKIKGTDLEDKNNIFLNFKSTDSDHRAQRMDHDQSDRTSFGRYTDMENWSHNGQTFSLKYTLQLDRDSGQAKLVISPQGDRNEPDDRLDVGEHGQVLDYLHTGQDVTQTGHWWQQGDRIEIRFDHISYGDTNRAKSERLIGHLKGTTIFITELDRAFYGQDAKLSFEKG